MGRPGTGSRKQTFTFTGVSEAFEGEPAKLSEAFASAAEQAIEAGVIEEGQGGMTAWFQVTMLEVELGNQHPKTLRVTITG